MKKLFLIVSLAIVLVFGGIVGTSNLIGNDTVIAADVSIEDVDCPCGCGMKAIKCLCGAAIEELLKKGFTAEDIEKAAEVTLID